MFIFLFKHALDALGRVSSPARSSKRFPTIIPRSRQFHENLTFSGVHYNSTDVIMHCLLSVRFAR